MVVVAEPLVLAPRDTRRDFFKKFRYWTIGDIYFRIFEIDVKVWANYTRVRMITYRATCCSGCYFWWSGLGCSDLLVGYCVYLTILVTVIGQSAIGLLVGEGAIIERRSMFDSKNNNFISTMFLRRQQKMSIPRETQVSGWSRCNCNWNTIA